MTLIAPSVLSADFGSLRQEVVDVAQAGADWIHVDVMDGRFVPNITIGPMVVRALHAAVNLPLDVHLMIVEPERYIDAFFEAGASILTVHAEACPHLHRTLQSIRDHGVRAGVSINPGTPISMIEHVLEVADLVLVMSVNPGFGGQKFIESSVKKIEQLAAIKKREKYEYYIQVDGGINLETAPAVVAAGADVLVAGNFVFKEKPYEKPIYQLHQACLKGLGK